jgi:hypothetical protein
MKGHGKWIKQDSIVVFTQEGTPDQVYNRASLLIAIDNVKKLRNSYKSQAAYDVDLRHFECGLSLIQPNAVSSLRWKVLVHLEGLDEDGDRIATEPKEVGCVETRFQAEFLQERLIKLAVIESTYLLNR